MKLQEYVESLKEERKKYDIFSEERKNIEDILYCLEEYYCCSKGFYELVLKYCLQHNIQEVYDIGCAYGWQSEIFTNHNIKYIGVERCELEFWNTDECTYIQQTYPFEIQHNPNAIAVSNLCVGYFMTDYKDLFSFNTILLNCKLDEFKEQYTITNKNGLYFDETYTMYVYQKGVVND